MAIAIFSLTCFLLLLHPYIDRNRTSSSHKTPSLRFDMVSTYYAEAGCTMKNGIRNSSPSIKYNERVSPVVPSHYEET